MDVVKLLKVINNNVVSAYDDAGKEIIVMGKGIGFHNCSGDLIDEAMIEKSIHCRNNPPVYLKNW